MSSTPLQTRSQSGSGSQSSKGLEGSSTSAKPGEVAHELGFYAAYHSNKINKAIHFVCIPIIFWTALILLAHVDLGAAAHKYLPSTVLAPGLAVQPNAALLVIVGYTAYYFYLEPFAALTFLPIGTTMYLTASYLATRTPLSLPLRHTSGFAQPSSVPFALALHVAGWIAQFIGHGVFEKRAPALLTNLTQALVLAPFFVHLEMLFVFFHYRPELERGMINDAGKRIAAMNRAARAARAKQG